MLSAILFDLDGTLVNTDPLHYRIWKEILKDYGLEIDQRFYDTRISGGLNPLIIKEILPDLSEAENLQLSEYKEARFRELASELKPVAGLDRILAWTEECNLKRALVTNAPRKNVELMLSVLGLTEAFNPVLIAEDVGVAKPDPALYKMGLNLLNIAPEQGLVFEDSPSGIRSAVGAGILTVGIASTHNPLALLEAGAFNVVPDFTDEQVWNLLRGADVTEAEPL
jgi:HAD superfamily hydrolase (TIGR01509 family)